MSSRVWMCALHWDPAETPQGDWKPVTAETADEAARTFGFDIARTHGSDTHTLLDVYVVTENDYDRFRLHGMPCVAVKYDVQILPARPLPFPRRPR